MFCQSLALGLLGSRVAYALKEPYTLVYEYWCWFGRIRCSPVPKAQQMSLKYISILRRSPVHNVKRLLPSRLTNQTQILCGTSMVMVLGGGGERMFAASNVRCIDDR